MTLERKHPRGYWEIESNKKNFLEKMKVVFKIKNPKDWGYVTTKEFRKAGGESLLSHYNNSLFSCLKHCYEGLFPL